MMEKKKVMIAGGAGYVGTILSSYLAELNEYDVTVADIFWFGDHLPACVQTIKTDLFNLDMEQLKPFDAIIFLAGLSNDPMAEFSPQDNFIYNTALPAYLAFQARQAGVAQFIFASSCSVYGYTHNRSFTEHDEAVSNYPYGVSKLQGERAVMALAAENFSVVCFRQGTISGYSQRMRLDLAINAMFKNAVGSGKICVTNPDIWRPILTLPDLCSAYRLALEKRANGLYNITSFNCTVGQMAEEVAEFVRQQFRKPVVVQNNRVQDYRNYKVSCEKAINELGYAPAHNLQYILENLKANLHHFSQFDDSNFYNIEVFRTLKTGHGMALITA